MIGVFLDDTRRFHPGRFPQVSRTGNWYDVGHYGQLIWPSTQKPGCALAEETRQEVLVRRYWPAGNIIGQQVP